MYGIGVARKLQERVDVGLREAPRETYYQPYGKRPGTSTALLLSAVRILLYASEHSIAHLVSIGYWKCAQKRPEGGKPVHDLRSPSLRSLDQPASAWDYRCQVL